MVSEKPRTLGEDYDIGQHLGKYYVFLAQAACLYRVDEICTLEAEDAEMEIHSPIKCIAATLFNARGKRLRASEHNSLLWSISERRNDPRAPEAFKPCDRE